MPNQVDSRRRRWSIVVVAALVVLTSTAGCDRLRRTASPGEVTQAQQVVDYGPCLPMYSRAVLSAAMDREGTKVLFVSGQRPDFIDEAAWGADDRALYLMEFPADGAPTLRAIARSWQATDEIPAYATPSDEYTRSPVPIPENMLDVQLDESGTRFVLGVTRGGVYGRYAKLYTGTVPTEAGRLLSPEDGLTVIPINDYQGTEGVTSFTISPDGSKVAAVVGSQGEIRIYDLVASQLTVYDRGADGKTVVRHDLPPAMTSIDQQRRPAVASNGTLYLRWAPQADRLAVSMDLGIANTSLAILNIATGEMSVVARFQDRTVPHVAWASDGQSLFVMVTRLSGPQTFGDTEIRRLAATENGRHVAQGGVLSRPLGYRGEPGALVSFGDDEHFVFVWDAALYRLDMPGGVPAQATYVPLTPSLFRVQYVHPSLAFSKERVIFVASDDFSSRLAERSYALHDDCPITATGVATATPSEPGAAAPVEPTAAVPAAPPGGTPAGEVAPTTGAGVPTEAPTEEGATAEPETQAPPAQPTAAQAAPVATGGTP